MGNIVRITQRIIRGGVSIGKSSRTGPGWHTYVVVIFALFTVAGCEQPLTGQYLAKSANGVSRLQLVETKGHQIEGQLDLVSYDHGGNVSAESLAVSGSTDGSGVTLTFKSPGFSLGALLASGQRSWRGLRLTGNFGSGLRVIEFVRSDDADYQSELRDIQASAEKVILANKIAADQRKAAQQRAQWVSVVNEFVAKMDHFEAEAPLRLKQWSQTEASLAAMTQDMNKKLALEKKLNGEAYYVQRGQLSVAINQEEIGTEQLEGGIENLRSTLAQNIVARIATAKNMDHLCKSKQMKLERTQFPEMAASCANIATTLSSVEPTYNAVESALSHLENTYRNEHEQQAAIVMESDRVE